MVEQKRAAAARLHAVAHQGAETEPRGARGGCSGLHRCGYCVTVPPLLHSPLFGPPLPLRRLVLLTLHMVVRLASSKLAVSQLAVSQLAVSQLVVS